MILRYAILCFFSIVIIGQNTAFAQGATLVDKFQSRDWTAHIYDDNGKKICFVASEPKSTLPTNVRRSKIIFYISSWPSDNVRNEVSIKIGYPFQPGSQPTAEIGTATFTFFVKDDKAFIASSDEEQRLVEAIKAGSSMTVRGLSARGTQTTDQYSLSGVTAALDRVAQNCS